MTTARKILKTIIPTPLHRPLLNIYRKLVPDSVPVVAAPNPPSWVDLPATPRDPNELRPPDELVHVGPGDFILIGKLFFPLFVEQGGLLPTDRVLDVGCGIGRMAVPLTTYLTNGSYEGFDIVSTGIEWCQQNITPRYPNFRFQLADIYNQFYHQQGTVKPENYRFPYPDNEFDFVFLTSVFTHMVPRDVENYLGQIARVLKPGKRCFITFYILNDESEALMQAGRSEILFAHSGEGYRTVSADVPESVIAFPEAYVRDLFQRHGLEISTPIYFGKWCGREQGLTYQDVVVAVKR